MQNSTDFRRYPSSPCTLDTLHALPCGCVAAVYRTQPLDTELVSVEARGPHCVDSRHQMGQILGLSVDEGRLSR